MDKNRINDRKLHLTRIAGFVGANPRDNMAMSLRTAEAMIHHRATMEEAIMYFMDVVDHIGKNTDMDNPEEVKALEKLYANAMGNMQIAAMDSMGTLPKDVKEKLGTI